jgi:hypothetical protein
MFCIVLLPCSCLDIFEIKKEFKDFLDENNIELKQKDVGFNQQPFLVMNEESVFEVLEFLLNPANQPTLLFCRDGKVSVTTSQRYISLTLKSLIFVCLFIWYFNTLQIKTSTVIGCLRAITNWSLVSAIDEFESYMGTDGNWNDIQFIETFAKTNKLMDEI